MNKAFKTATALVAALGTAASAFAANVTLYALDGRTIEIDEELVSAYTAEGMGWFAEKPVELYSLDGRKITVEADKVAANKAVGWYSYDELPDNVKSTITPTTPSTPTPTPPQPTDEKVAVKYTDGTIVTVPAAHLDMYKALGWEKTDGQATAATKITVYNASGEEKQIDESELAKYQTAGWTTVKPTEETVTVYNCNGEKKEIAKSSAESAKASGWYGAFDEAVYAYAAFGDGATVKGATALLEEKQYEQAFNLVQDAVDKIEDTSSEYVSMLYYLRSMVTDAWREAANSPLGFVNYWFSEKDGKDLIVFEYRNVSNSRITSFRINFDICDGDGNVVETNSGSYYVSNLQMLPCEKKRVAWVIKSGDKAKSIKNLKVTEVVFSDNTKWNRAD